MDHLRKALTHCKYPQMGHRQDGKRLSKPANEGGNDVDSQGTAGTKPPPMK